MKPFICLVHRKDRDVPEMTVIACEPDEFDHRLREMLRFWPSLLKVEILAEDGARAWVPDDASGAGAG